MLDDYHVAVYNQEGLNYCNIPPYNAPQGFPEYPFKDNLCTSNATYEAVRNTLLYLGLDKQRFGLPSWNPLGSIVEKGDSVLVKPNMIAQSHRYSDEWEHVITHGSVIRAAIDYVYIALRGEGRIIIADAPQTDSDINLIKERMAIESIQEFYWKQKKFEVEFRDLRNEHWVEENGIYVETKKLTGDPLGNVRVNLGANSYLAENDGKGMCYYGAFYDVQETNKHHSKGVHEYLISKTAIECDAFISLPKLKTHKKVGVTLNLKGLVGINGDKNWLPHYALGTPDENGDQFPAKKTKRKLENILVLNAKKLLLNKNPVVQKLAVKLKSAGYFFFGDTESVIRSGNWHGNDTCWRMTSGFKPHITLRQCRWKHEI